MSTFKKIFTGDYLKRLDNIIQWQEKDVLTQESVSKHSYKVAVFATAIMGELFPAEDMDNRITQGVQLLTIQRALFHDWDEAFILRDLSHEMKYNEYNGKQIRKAVDSLASHLLEKEFGGNNVVNTAMTTPDALARDVCKLADWLAMAYFLNREIRLGNQTLKTETETVFKGLNVSAHTCRKIYLSYCQEFNLRSNVTLFDELINLSDYVIG